MENYEKAETIEIDVDHAALFQRLPQLPDNPVVMKVRGSSKIQSLLDVAIAKLKDDTVSGARSIIFHGAGPAINKMITCVEILKRRVKELHQINKLSYEEVEEIWNPKLEGLNVLKVSRKIPMMHTLLSKELLPKEEPGYQKA